jgi:hypothetical protein
MSTFVLPLPCLVPTKCAAGLTCPAVSIQPNQLPKMRQTSLVLISSLPNNLLVLASSIVIQADIGLSGPEPRPVVRLMIPCTNVLGVVGVYRSKAELE